jgi:tetratricopeptide (TPR) repeat protein
MLKRVLIFCVCALLAGPLVYGQVDLNKVKALYDQELYEEAVKEIRSLLVDKQKNTDEMYYWLGMIQYQREDYAGARKNFEMGLSERSKSPLNKIGLGLIAFKENSLSDGKSLVQEGLDMARGKDPEVEFAAADALLEGSYDEIGDAKQILYDLRDRLPDDPRPNIKLGEYYKKQGVLELAIEELEKAIAKDPSYVAAYVYLAELYFDEGKETKQSESFNKGFTKAQEAIKLDPEYGPAYRIRGELYLLLGKYEEAKNDLQKYVSLAQADRRARIRYASFLFLSKDYEGAIAEMNSIDTTTNVMRRLKGMSFYQLDRLDEAKAAMDDYFKNVLKEEYIIYEDYQVLGDILRAKGDLVAADDAYMKMILKNDEKATIFEDLAEDYYKQARGKERDAYQMNKSRRAALKEAQEATDVYNELAKEAEAAEDMAVKQAKTDEAKAKFAIREAKIAEAATLETEADMKDKEAIPFYKLEAHYRQKAVDMADPLGLPHYYKLGLSLYKSEQWEAADAAFIKVHELKADYLNPYIYRIQIAQKLEAEDKESNSWYIKAPCEDIIEVWGGKAPAELEDKEQQNLLLAYDVMANYSFNPTGEEGVYNCEEARPYIDKIQAIDPAYERIKSLSDYCASVNK